MRKEKNKNKEQQTTTYSKWPIQHNMHLLHNVTLYSWCCIVSVIFSFEYFQQLCASFSVLLCVIDDMPLYETLQIHSPPATQLYIEIWHLHQL